MDGFVFFWSNFFIQNNSAGNVYGFFVPFRNTSTYVFFKIQSAMENENISNNAVHIFLSCSLAHHLCSGGGEEYFPVTPVPEESAAGWCAFSQEDGQCRSAQSFASSQAQTSFSSVFTFWLILWFRCRFSFSKQIISNCLISILLKLFILHFVFLSGKYIWTIEYYTNWFF